MQTGKAGNLPDASSNGPTASQTALDSYVSFISHLRQSESAASHASPKTPFSPRETNM